jgi:hypothetical protein
MSTTTRGVTTTVTTLAKATLTAEAKGSTIPDILLHEYLIAKRAANKAQETIDHLEAVMKQYMDGESTNELESAEAKAIRYPVKNRADFDKEGLERDHPAIYATYYTPGVGTHPAFKVTPRA